jgi:hypothetical protein
VRGFFFVFLSNKLELARSVLRRELEHMSIKPDLNQSVSRSSRIQRPITKAAMALADSQMLRDRRVAFLTRDETRARVRADYLELPGLILTASQAARLWAIDHAIATDVLDELTEAGFLLRNGDQYARR